MSGCVVFLNTSAVAVVGGQDPLVLFAVCPLGNVSTAAPAPINSLQLSLAFVLRCSSAEIQCVCKTEKTVITAFNTPDSRLIPSNPSW